MAEQHCAFDDVRAQMANKKGLRDISHTFFRRQDDRSFLYVQINESLCPLSLQLHNAFLHGSRGYQAN